jgi:hypothetical protein
MPGPDPSIADGVQKKNRDNLKALGNKSTINFQMAGVTFLGGAAGPPKHENVLLIGDGHKAPIVRLVMSSHPAHGTVDIGKGGLTGAGSLTVSGVASGDQQAFKRVIAEFSKKKVIFN